MKRFLACGLIPLALAGCDAMTAHTDVVARAGRHELSVDQMADLLATNPRLPATSEVAGSVADLWVDYTILAELAGRDTLLADLDFAPLIAQYVEQRTFMDLREQVVTTDTVIDEAELRRLYGEQAPGARVRARHILLTVPGDADEAQRDSLRALADSLRERVLAGEDFAELAGEYSADPGSARAGGDLGWFERGRMVRPFEEAAFALQPGEVSEPVESPFGIHLIRVEERETPAFEEISPEFRQRVVQQRQQESLNAYLESLTGPADVRLSGNALDVARNLIREPTADLGDRAGNRELVEWQGGSLTAREFLRFARQIPPQMRAQFASAPDEQLDGMLRDVATNEMVLADAAGRGISVPQTEQDSITAEMRQQVIQAARQAGLTGPPQEGESQQEAVDRRVRTYLEGVLAGRQNLLPLGPLTYVLRQAVDWRIHDRTFSEVVDAMEERQGRAADEEPAPTPPLPGAGDAEPGTTPDATPGAAPEATPEAAPGVTPGGGPGGAPEGPAAAG